MSRIRFTNSDIVQGPPYCWWQQWVICEVLYSVVIEICSGHAIKLLAMLASYSTSGRRECNSLLVSCLWAGEERRNSEDCGCRLFACWMKSWWGTGSIAYRNNAIMSSELGTSLTVHKKCSWLRPQRDTKHSSILQTWNNLLLYFTHI